MSTSEPRAERVRPALSQAVLTAREVADVAGVQRPVVSVWRKRSSARGRVVPFPPPVFVAEGVEYFDADEVVAWLESTGRGNNRDFALDARAAGVPLGGDLTSLTTLLCLRVLGGRTLAGRSGEELVELADEMDPDDAMVLREVETLGAVAVRLAPFVDGLFEASFGPEDALDRLLATRAGRSAPRSLVTAGITLVATAVDAAADALPAHAGVIDCVSNPVGLALDVVRACGTARTVEIEGADDRTRPGRRTAALRGVEVATGEVGNAPRVAFLSVVGMSPDTAIDAVAELQLQTSDSRYAVVVGPASVLCDRLDDAALERARSGILRSDHLRLAARLPRGLWTGGPRQMLAMWVFAPGGGARIEDRTMTLVDMSRALLTGPAAEGLGTDVVAALTDPVRHSFSFGRLARTSAVIAAGEIVPQGLAPQRFSRIPGGARAVRIDELAAQLSEPLGPSDVASRVEPSEGRAPRLATIGELIASRSVALVSGSRLDRSLATSHGTVRLADPDVTGTAAFDPLDLAEHYGDLARTRAGDVVFALAPRPCAVVDPGGAVVAYPARILRLVEGSGVSPQVLAAQINRRAATDREWRGWRVPLLDDHRNLDAALVALGSERAAIRERLDLLDALVGEILDGTTDGTMAVNPPEGA